MKWILAKSILATVAGSLAVLLILPSRAAGQDSLNAPTKWTLQDCISYAFQHNIDVNTLRLQQKSGEQDLLQSRAAVMPSLSASSSQSLVNSKNANPVVGGFQTQANFSSNYSVSSNITLFNGGFLKNDIKQKELSVQAAALNVQEAENNITLSITQAFLNILLSRENIVYLNDLVATSQAQLQQGQLRYRAGSISRKDLVQLEAQAAADQYSLTSAENTLRLNRVNLKQILQLPTSDSFDVRTPDTLEIKQAVLSLSEAQKSALDSRPEIKYGQTQVDIAQLDLEKARAAGLPTLSLGAGLSSGYSDNQTSKYFTQIKNNFFQQVGVSIGVPIYSRRTIRTGIEKSKIAISQQQLALQNNETLLNQAVEQAYINLQNAQAAYQAADAQLKASQESYQIANDALRIGSSNLTDLLVQKNLYVQAMQNYLQAKYTALLNTRIYNFYAGMPVTL